MSANLYDTLDQLYREIWGMDLHHGLWLSDEETVEEARKNLRDKVIDALQPAGTVADVGCGYGQLAHQLARSAYCRILANTDSKAQADQIPNHPGLRVLRGDWLAQTLPAGSLDRIVAVESLSHFASFSAFWAHSAPLMKSGARIVIADWFSQSGHHWWLRHLAGTGKLPPWRSTAELIKSAAAQGFDLEAEHSHELSQEVKATWSQLWKRSLRHPFSQPRLLWPLFRQALARPSLLWSFPFIRLAYETGHLEYHLLSFRAAR